jgi:hypothetical protein
MQTIKYLVDNSETITLFFALLFVVIIPNIIGLASIVAKIFDNRRLGKRLDKVLKYVNKMALNRKPEGK